MEAHAFRVCSRSVEIDAQCYASQPATCQIARQMASCLQEGHIVFLPRGKPAPFTHSRAERRLEGHVHCAGVH